MDHHNQSFFGQKSAIILDSAKSSDSYIYLRFLKKLPDGRWEKPSQGEGKNLKLNLLEIVDILHVLNTPNTRWSTVHKFGDQQTSIKVEHRADSDSVLFFITGYAKPLSRTGCNQKRFPLYRRPQSMAESVIPRRGLLPITW